MGAISASLARQGAALVIALTLLPGVAAPPVLAADPVATSIDMSAATAPLGGVPFTANVVLNQVDPPGPATGATGDVTVTEGATTLGTCALASGTCGVMLTLATGDHTLAVSYPGDAGFEAASRDDVTWSVIANTIEATGVGLNYGTFYPYKDGYRDAVTARGTRNEAASVKIKVYSPANKLLKTAPAIASATGAYSWAWNGRNSSGTMYPAGKYKITQTLNDGYMTSTVTKFVNLSAKRLYTKTVALKKTVSQRSAGSLSAGWLGWKFTLPSATVYKKLVFAVYGKSGTPRGLFGPHSYSLCPSTTQWDWYDCMSPYATFPASASWKSVTGSVSRNRHGSTVKMYAVGGNRTAVQYARVTVTYAVLK